MDIQTATINNKKIFFTVVDVPPTLLNSSQASLDFQEEYKSIFKNVAIVLCAIEKGVPKYFGRTDLIDYLQTA